MARTFLRLSLLALVLAFAGLSTQREATAIFHIAAISEVMSGFNGDPEVQYLEVRMDAPGQNLVRDTVLSVFDEDSVPPLREIMILPNDVPNSGTDLRWLVATQAFVDLTGLTPDFIMPPDILTPKGMVCWGGPDFAPPPDQWDHNLPFLYTDCVAYGGYTGDPPSTHPPAHPSPPGDGEKALQRVFPLPITETGLPQEAYELYCLAPAPAGLGERTPLHINAPPDEEAFFPCCPTPRNNSGETLFMGVDDDNDGLPNCHEGDVGTDPANEDTDQDGCSDGQEVVNSVDDGGRRNPTNFWDFFDAPAGAPPMRDQAVSIVDIGAVVARFGETMEPPLTKQEALVQALTTPPPSGYHAAFDRSTDPAGLSGPPDGSINIVDIGLVVLQFGNSCSPA